MSEDGDSLDDLASSAPDASLDEKAEREAAGLAFGVDINSAKGVAQLNKLGRQDEIDTLLR